MPLNEASWREHLDIITAWGQASAANRTPPPTDPRLWAVARMRRDLHLPEQPDPALLAQLRAAFNRGRRPHLIDLVALADALRHRGYGAVVEQTGGGMVTLFAGRRELDRHGELRWSAAVGPGRYENGQRQQPVADPAGCVIGPDGDDTWAIPVPGSWALETLVELTAAVIDEVENERARFIRATAIARNAMWAAFAAEYPDVVTADVNPDPDSAFGVEFTKVLAGWLDDNRPGGDQPPAHLAALAHTDPVPDTGPEQVATADAAEDGEAR